MMIGNTPNFFTLYNYCILEHDETTFIEDLFPTFDLENNNINLILYEVKDEDFNVQNFSTREIKTINNEITKSNKE